jgi:hypothetical protein
VDGQPTPVDFQTGQLHLRAKIAKLTVTNKHSGRWCQSPKCDEGVHDECELSVFDSDGLRAGVVTLDGNSFAYLKQHSHMLTQTLHGTKRLRAMLANQVVHRSAQGLP